jgi:hypothetical protein
MRLPERVRVRQLMVGGGRPPSEERPPRPRVHIIPKPREAEVRLAVGITTHRVLAAAGIVECPPKEKVTAEHEVDTSILKGG